MTFCAKTYIDTGASYEIMAVWNKKLQRWELDHGHEPITVSANQTATLALKNAFPGARFSPQW